MVIRATAASVLPPVRDADAHPELYSHQLWVAPRTLVRAFVGAAPLPTPAAATTADNPAAACPPVSRLGAETGASTGPAAPR